MKQAFTDISAWVHNARGETYSEVGRPYPTYFSPQCQPPPRRQPFSKPMTMPPLLPPAVPLGRRVDAMSIYGNNPYSPRVYSLQVEELRQALNEANADRELLTRDNATLERQIETHQTLAASRHNTGNRPYPSSNRRSPSPSPRTGSTAAVELASLKASLQDVTAALNETSASLEEERQGHEARLARLEVEALNRARGCDSVCKGV